MDDLAIAILIGAVLYLVIMLGRLLWDFTFRG